MSKGINPKEIKDPHPQSDARFKALFEEMVVRGSPPDRQKSRKDSAADCSGTQTPSRTSQGASEKTWTCVPRIESLSRAQ